MIGKVMDMRQYSIEEIKQLHDVEWKEAADTYGDVFSIPKSVIWMLSERDRARYCSAANPGWSAKELVSYYSIDQSIATEVFGTVDVSILARTKRADKYEAIWKWCGENVFAQVTPKEIAEIGDISYPTALKLVGDRVDFFRKVKHGLYEVRDPKADREAEKNK